MTDRTSPETETPLTLIDKRLADLREANDVFRTHSWDRSSAIARNEREISWLRDLRSAIVLCGHAQTAQQPDAGPVAATVLELLSPSNLPMENHPDVLQVARAIAERGIGRYWDDFPETDAFDTDQGDLIEYARAAVEIFRKSARPVDVAQRPIEPVLNSLMHAVLDHPGTSKEAKIELRAKLRSIIAPLYASDTSTLGDTK